jgi:hypothetical protein
MDKLTIEQEFFLEKVKIEVKSKTKEQLEKDLVDLATMMLQKENMYRTMLLTGAGIL